MRVAFPMRVDALDKPGGDTEHLRTYIRTCQHLDPQFHGEIFTDLNPNLGGFDVVHLSNLDRPVDLYAQFLAAKHAGKPIVLTPLHHSYREIETYERHGRGGLIGAVSGFVGFHHLEAFRILVKSIRYPQLRPALWKAVKKGLRRAQVEVLLGCSRLLVITEKEAREIAVEVAEVPPARVILLRNGYCRTSTTAVVRDIDIAVVARLESRKNQLAILEALESLGLQATFVGPPNPNHKAYCEHFRARIAQTSSTYIPGVPASEVAGILSRAYVHVAASWFEVASLVDLDAYTQGCRVVASRCGGTAEVLGDDAYYVDPASPQDIADKIAAAVQSIRDGKRNSMEKFLEQSPSWEETCTQLLAAYKSLVHP